MSNKSERGEEKGETRGRRDEIRGKEREKRGEEGSGGEEEEKEKKVLEEIEWKKKHLLSLMGLVWVGQFDG